MELPTNMTLAAKTTWPGKRGTESTAKPPLEQSQSPRVRVSDSHRHATMQVANRSIPTRARTRMRVPHIGLEGMTGGHPARDVRSQKTPGTTKYSDISMNSEMIGASETPPSKERKRRHGIKHAANAGAVARNRIPARRRLRRARTEASPTSAVRTINSLFSTGAWASFHYIAAFSSALGSLRPSRWSRIC
jgi:hypothetical protein